MNSNLQILKTKINAFVSEKEIVILGGGNSSESDTSKITSKQVMNTLKRLRMKCKLIDPEKNRVTLLRDLKNAGFVFLGLHGGRGENGIIQGWLDFNNIKYTGSSVLTSGIGMNKIVTKKLLEASGIPTPKFVIYSEIKNSKRFINKSEKVLKYPLFIKIADEGSGNGVFLVKNRKKFKKILLNLINNTRTNMLYAEKFVKGREISACILETNGKTVVLPILEAIFEAEYFDYEVRNKPNGYKNEVPAKLLKKVETVIENIAVLTYKSLFADSYLRLDIRLEIGSNIPYVIEVTTLPGLTEKSWLPAMAKNYGFSFDELILRIILSALEVKYEHKSKS